MKALSNSRCHCVSGLHAWPGCVSRTAWMRSISAAMSRTAASVCSLALFRSEGAFKLALPLRVRLARVARLRFAHGLDAEHFRCDVAHGGFRLLLGLVPI